MADDIDIKLDGMERLISRLRALDAFAAPVARRLLNRSAYAAQAEIQKRTPVVTGTLRRSMATMVDPAEFPTFAKVGTNLSYARFIEFGERINPITREVEKRKAGPARMLRDGAQAAVVAIRTAVAQAARELEAAWRR